MLPDVSLKSSDLETSSSVSHFILLAHVFSFLHPALLVCFVSACAASRSAIRSGRVCLPFMRLWVSEPVPVGTLGGNTVNEMNWKHNSQPGLPAGRHNPFLKGSESQIKHTDTTLAGAWDLPGKFSSTWCRSELQRRSLQGDFPLSFLKTRPVNFMAHWCA